MRTAIQARSVLIGIVLLARCSDPVSYGDDYQLPKSIYQGDLTGSEILFWPVDSRSDVEKVSGVFAVNPDGSHVRRLCGLPAAGDVSAVFLDDHRVVCIRDGHTSGPAATPDDIVLLDHGTVTPLGLPVTSDEHVLHVTALKGPSSGKILYTVLYQGTYIYDLATRESAHLLRQDQGKVTTLADGRIAVTVYEGIQIMQLDGSVDLTVPYPEGIYGGYVLELADGRLLLCHRSTYVDYELYAAEKVTNPMWSRITGFPDAYPPQEPGFGPVGIQLTAGDHLAYIHEDNYDEENPYFNVMVGKIGGNRITDVKTIFESRIDTHNGGIYYLEWVIY